MSYRLQLDWLACRYEDCYTYQIDGLGIICQLLHQKNRMFPSMACHTHETLLTICNTAAVHAIGMPPIQKRTVGAFLEWANSSATIEELWLRWLSQRIESGIQSGVMLDRMTQGNTIAILRYSLDNTCSLRLVETRFLSAHTQVLKLPSSLYISFLIKQISEGLQHFLIFITGRALAKQRTCYHNDICTSESREIYNSIHNCSPYSINHYLARLSNSIPCKANGRSCAF